MTMSVKFLGECEEEESYLIIYAPRQSFCCGQNHTKFFIWGITPYAPCSHFPVVGVSEIFCYTIPKNV